MANQSHDLTAMKPQNKMLSGFRSNVHKKKTRHSFLWVQSFSFLKQSSSGFQNGYDEIQPNKKTTVDGVFTETVKYILLLNTSIASPTNWGKLSGCLHTDLAEKLHPGCVRQNAQSDDMCKGVKKRALIVG